VQDQQIVDPRSPNLASYTAAQGMRGLWSVISELQKKYGIDAGGVLQEVASRCESGPKSASQTVRPTWGSFSITSESGDGDLPLLSAFKGAILASKLPGVS